MSVVDPWDPCCWLDQSGLVVGSFGAWGWQQYRGGRRVQEYCLLYYYCRFRRPGRGKNCQLLCLCCLLCYWLLLFSSSYDVTYDVLLLPVLQYILVRRIGIIICFLKLHSIGSSSSSNKTKQHSIELTNLWDEFRKKCFLSVFI